MAATLAAAGLLVGKTWNAHETVTDDTDASRTRAVRLLERTLEITDRRLAKVRSDPDFDGWLAGLRDEFRPCFSALTSAFDSQLIPIIWEFASHADDSGPLREHSRQLALMSLRSLLEEERRRLEDGSVQREGVDEKLVKLPLSILRDD